MSKDRLIAFTDGVLAIVITIMVLKLELPKKPDLVSIKSIYPNLLAYILSYLYVGIYWVNHHHIFEKLDYVSRKILWENLLWIFFITLIPMATEWVGLNPFESLPAVFYGLILLLCAITYFYLQREVINISEENIGHDNSLLKDFKAKISIYAYIFGTLIAFYFSIIAYIVYAIVAIIWIFPDKKLVKKIKYFICQVL